MGQRLYKSVLTQRGIDKLKLNNLQNIHVHTHTHTFKCDLEICFKFFSLISTLNIDKKMN